MPLEKLLALPSSTDYQNMAELESILAAEKSRCHEILKIEFSSLSDIQVDEIRVRYTGKKSPLQNLLKSLKNLPGEERRGAGALVNELKNFIETEIEKFISSYRTWKEEAALANEKVDITLPLPELSVGSRHPISSVINELLEPLRRMGFTVVDGPELDKDFYNFEALNIPPSHPSREMQDSFFLPGGWLLRTQTSNVQSHAMMERGVPIKIACPGYVYRNEYDLTHVPAFRQLECLVVDKGIHLGHMRHTINCFFNEIFGRPMKMRLRSSYFPFTEPSAEVDVECAQCGGSGCRSCKHTGWLEMGGCGLVHRNVLEKCGIDPDVYSGFAFGMGVDRIAMIKYAVSDLRAMFDGDVAFLKDFKL